jgi:hypothetical protein
MTLAHLLLLLFFFYFYSQILSQIWNYDATAQSIEDLVGQLALTGSLLPKYKVASLAENSAIAFDPATGDFEVWQFEIVDGKLQISTQKRDSIDNGVCHHDFPSFANIVFFVD